MNINHLLTSDDKLFRIKNQELESRILAVLILIRYSLFVIRDS